MNDPLAKTLDEISEAAKDSGLQIFFSPLLQNESLTAEWSQRHGGDWKNFLACAKAVGANLLYLHWVPFEQFQIDDAAATIESDLARAGDSNDGTDTKKLLGHLRAFETKVGLTCVIELAFLASGVVHIYQGNADWYEDFEKTFNGEIEDEDEPDQQPIDKDTLNKWATALASDPKYMTSKQREYLLEKLAVDEFPKLPVFDVLTKAEAIFEVGFRQTAEEKLADEVRQLREQGLNLNAIAQKLRISRDRVSGIASTIPGGKRTKRTT
jgi:hypothetical protein